MNLFANLLDPPILFFFFGLFAVFVRSNLEIPGQIAKFFSLYLLMSIGFKGGVALSASGINLTVALSLLAALFMATFVPVYTYAILRTRLDGFNAAAICATYGSVSAVTFIAAGAFLNGLGVEYGGHMTVALAIMESPAIIVALYFANRARRALPPEAGNMSTATPHGVTTGALLKEALTDGSHLLLLGSLVIGLLAGEKGRVVLAPFTADIFKGVLSFFLLEMGLFVGKRMREAKSIQPFLVAFAILVPLANATIAAFIARAIGLAPGDAFMLMILSASSSYIVVPAVVRYAIPEANAGMYFTMSLAMTFPFNISLGIPLYFQGVRLLWGV